MITSAPPLRVSAIDAAQQAIEHTRRHLFPFRFERWLALGFVAFLDQCGRSGGGGVPNPGGGNWGGNGGGGGDISEAMAWLGSHVGLVVLIATVALAVVVGLTALVLWVNSRGIFMYLDNVATGRSEIARPWKEHAERAGSLFAWQFVLALATLVSVVLLVLFGAAVFFAAAKGRASAGLALALVLLVALPLLLLVALVAGLASMALRDFVAPLQMCQGISCGDAVRLFLPLLRSHAGAFVLYVLLKVAFHIAAGMIVLTACCVCCCVLLPVVCQTALQPLFYFERAWSLCLLRQLGHDVLGDKT